MPVTIPPAGLTPAGLFVPNTFADPSKPPGILADAIDPATGEYLSISRGMDPIDSQVILALTVRRASGASVTEDGQDFDEVKKVDDAAAKGLEARTQRALERLLTNGDIAVDRLTPTADQDTDEASVGLVFRNLRAAKTQKARNVKVTP